jgi:hypothetical protein
MTDAVTLPRGRPRVSHEPRICELLREDYTVAEVASVFPELDISTIRKIAYRNGIRYKRAPVGRAWRGR